MAKTSVYDYSTTAASNSDFDGTDSSGATGKVKDGDNYARSIASHIKGFANDLGGVNTVAGTGDAITITLSGAPTALVDGMRLTFNASAANTTNVTLTVTPNGGASFGSKKVLKWSGGSETALSANDIPAANALIELIYDTARDTAAGAWMLLGTSVASATTSAQGIVALNYFGIAQNVGLAATVGASALTVSLKGADGNAPSSTNPVIVPFRSATLATGTPVFRTVTAAASVVVASTKTMGSASGVAFRLWVVAVDTGSGIELGLVNCLSGTSIMSLLADLLYSPTATPGNSAQVIYTTSGQTSKPICVLGYLDFSSGEATAGTWATAPDRIQVRNTGTKLPGDIVQAPRTPTGAVASGSTAIPDDDTIPQITEGNEFMTQAITPTATPNLLKINALANLYNGTAGQDILAALFQDSTANALAACWMPGQGLGVQMAIDFAMLAATVSSTTFRFRAGGSSGTTTFNGAIGARRMGGVMNSYMQVMELMG